MPQPTRTIGPLHLEDLEPHRFEDLIRQLIYDFRNWRQLEATGRGGSDDGFDARGWEITNDFAEIVEAEKDEEDVEALPQPSSDRKWLVQCKREKAIPPKKLENYLSDILGSELPSLHGIIFAAACDFSKKARDTFRDKARTMGFSEAHLWGKAEIEDLLFQPKNDHLLFAYFGISLQVRKRSLKTELRSRLAMKRKAVRLLKAGDAVIIRDVTDERYPWLDEDEKKEPRERGRWKVLRFNGHDHDGLHFIYRSHFAFLDQDNVYWDFAETMNDAPLHSHDDPWFGKPHGDPERAAMYALWDALPEVNKAWYTIVAILPYENILDIDEHGDGTSKHPQVLTPQWIGAHDPFRDYPVARLATSGRFDSRDGFPEHETRLQKFPRISDRP